SEAVQRYLATKERSIESLFQIATAALEVVDLDYFLKRLVDLLHYAAPDVSRAAILVREGTQALRVRASYGVKAIAGETVPLSNDFVGSIVRDRRGRELRIDDAASRGTPLLGWDGARVLFGVPLVVDEDVIGVVVVGATMPLGLSTDDK